jgi:hypothetical protein
MVVYEVGGWWQLEQALALTRAGDGRTGGDRHEDVADATVREFLLTFHTYLQRSVHTTVTHRSVVWPRGSYWCRGPVEAGEQLHHRPSSPLLNTVRVRRRSTARASLRASCMSTMDS